MRKIHWIGKFLHIENWCVIQEIKFHCSQNGHPSKSVIIWQLCLIFLPQSSFLKDFYFVKKAFMLKWKLFISWYSSIPYMEPSRPSPDSLTPPKGTCSGVMAVSLTPSNPTCKCLVKESAWAKSLVYTKLARPASTLFAISMASSSVLNLFQKGTLNENIFQRHIWKHIWKKLFFEVMSASKVPKTHFI